MEKLDDISPQIKIKLRKKLIPAKILLDRFRVMDEWSRQAAMYTDPIYLPVYYYLGSLITPKNMLDVGFGLGLVSGCFLSGCKTVIDFLAFQQKTSEYYTPRLAKKNIRLIYRNKFEYYGGNLYDDVYLNLLQQKKWDTILINEENSYDYIRLLLDQLWTNLSVDGILVIERTNDNHAFVDFCKIKNRTPHFFKTRYQLGIVQK
jgi:hypothetical protein